MEEMNVPYIVYESALARSERQLKRLVVVIIILIFTLFASNAIWLVMWNSFEYVEETSLREIQLDAEYGNANFIGGSGRIVNGEDTGSDSYTQEIDAEEER